MSKPITDELREFANEIDERAGYGVVMPNPTSKHSGAPYGPSSETEELYAIADRIDAQHEKLKQLCADMWYAIPKTESCGWDASANTCVGIDECRGECALWYRMYELGVEVPE